MRLVIVSILAGLVLPGFGEDQAPGGPFVQQVANLGHADFRVRERAHQRLREAGDKARVALEDAAENSEDAEVRERASILLHRMGAGARIAEAITKLDAHEWDEVRRPLPRCVMNSARTREWRSPSRRQPMAKARPPRWHASCNSSGRTGNDSSSITCGASTVFAPKPFSDSTPTLNRD